MAKRDIGLEILEGILEVKACKTGKIDLRTRELQDPPTPQEIRKHLNLSQAAFRVMEG